MSEKPSHVCQPCWDGDHSSHSAAWGGICIGCSCDQFDPPAVSS